jgi:two-component system KDP operon response regulator KdpE
MHTVARNVGARARNGPPAPTPVPATRRASGPAADPLLAPARATRILIVEDDPALVRVLRISLRARSYDVATAPTGQAALAEAARHSPDAVILDLGLPDLDGVEVIRELRGWSWAPVMVLSGRAETEDKIGALNAGADDYVTKPFSMKELLARLRNVLRPGQAAARRLQ